MVLSNTRLALSIATKFVRRSKLTLDELYQEGCMGLQKAAEIFDPNRGKFSTIATYWVSQYIRRAIADQGRTIRYPVYLEEELSKLKSAKARLAMVGNDDPTVEQIAEAMDLPPEKVENLLTVTRQPDSLDRLLHPNGTAAHYHYEPDRTTPGPEQIADQNILKEELAEVLSRLTAREAKILKLRYGLDDGISRTLTEVGDIYGLSRERIRQIELDAFTKLRRWLKVWMLREFIDA